MYVSEIILYKCHGYLRVCNKKLTLLSIESERKFFVLFELMYKAGLAQA